ncbi:Apolipoprotein N-acyltransferase [Desulfocicer vacuolatum DSM 3385]|uniref:Apolipoprotein N-acyltransferase n=1 Tax=Desulfocicer vacuolatum DSM 3385 TaxID=1121400 RepID=A0A1W2DWJ0_9BACT|nr:apolipoprotein N-acyltransferase [Desulfocicer vacuolatum]SMD01935.1 Apolipoprotein N-acyltransferase [Desulfocicer vacuolatum DSM 3385]
MSLFNFFPERLLRYFPALTSGFIMTLAFPATQWSWLAWGALIPLLLSIRGTSPAQAFGMGLAMGMGHFFSLIYWILPTLRIYGNLPVLLAMPVLILMVFYLALYPAFFCMIISRDCFDTHFSAFLPLKAASLWVALEFTRANIFTGFPWGLTGYSQYLNINLIQMADITGVYGVSFIIVAVNATLAMAWHHRGNEQHPPEIKKSRRIALFTWAALLLPTLGGIMIYGHKSMTATQTAMAHAPKQVVSVIQGNIPQAAKWDDAYKTVTVSTYCELSRSNLSSRPRDLIVWPETALPFYYTWDEESSHGVNQCIRQSNAWFIIGSPAFSLVGEDDFHFFNRAYMLTPRAIVSDFYDKSHLVPFGEYVPFGKYLTFLDKLTSQAGDFSPGSSNAKPLAFKGSRAGVLICFEIIFPELAATVVKNGADLLVTMTNDAWFGRTSAPLQHFSMAVFRAVENRRSVARAANTGISGFIDPRGVITGTTALFEKTTLTRQVPCISSMSFYTTHGDVFAWVCLISALIFACPWKKFYMKRQPPRQPQQSRPPDGQ